MAHSSLLTADVNDPEGIRQGSASWLSLALMDARNRSLLWFSAFETLSKAAELDGFDPPAWLVGHVAWFQEYWISRCPQRNRGAEADPAGLRLASIDPLADDWFAPAALSRAQRWAAAADIGNRLRGYLAATLDTTLELLEKADGSDASLYFFRLALLQEDRLAEALAELARAVALPLPIDSALLTVPPARGRREPIGFASGQVLLGTPGSGFAPDNERPAREVAVPPFEMDAQAVSWAEFAEFAADGGYDDRRLWSPAGWDWIEATQRRAPRYVEQLIEGVLVHRSGRIERAPSGQAVQHVSAHEADAWCQWAGRRLPTEPEFAMALGQARARGLAWGDGVEWVAGTAQVWAGQQNGPARLDLMPESRNDGLGACRVLRGASTATVPRQRHPRARRYARAGADALFSSFRSCAF